MGFLKKLTSRSWYFLPVDLEAKKEAYKEKSGKRLRTFSDEKHLTETASWLCRAQDYSNDGGVCRAYKAARYGGCGSFGWQPSYPETTGYIIPTMLSLSDLFNDSSYSARAFRMAEWEIDIQLPSGAVMGSVVTALPSPAVFNTGQVIFGWLEAYRESGDRKYLEAALSAGVYLVSVQNQDGSWAAGNSRYALDRATTYNSRVAWALIELGLETSDSEYIYAGRRNVDFALTKQLDNGWFADNCLNDPENPLLHTIVYAARGVLESGLSLNESRYVDAAIKTLNALMLCQQSDGGLPGRLSSDWAPMVDWDCLTGDAQAAIVWLRANAITGEKKYKEAAGKAIDFIKKTQNLEHPNLGMRGGVKGSFPFDGPYGQYEMLNWAAKFFCDALMLINDEELAKKGIRG